MKYVFDTNVYLEAVRSEAARTRFRDTFYPLLPATYLSAVVAYELAVNASDRRTQTLLRDFVRPMERTGRVITPTFDDWVMASEVVTTIGENEQSWRSKLPALLNDILIALSARRIGATLLTYNREDFRLIRRRRYGANISWRIANTEATVPGARCPSRFTSRSVSTVRN